MRTVAVLAHQGGWDEILMVMGPIGLIAGLLRLAKRVAGSQIACLNDNRTKRWRFEKKIKTCLIGLIYMT